MNEISGTTLTIIALAFFACYFFVLYIFEREQRRRYEEVIEVNLRDQPGYPNIEQDEEQLYGNDLISGMRPDLHTGLE